MMINKLILFAIFYCFVDQKVCASTWSEWWTYNGISGPEFWGLVNPEWNLCVKGKRQSPIDIDPRKLLFDPGLKNIKMDHLKTSGYLVNTGKDVRFQMEDGTQEADVTGINQMFVNVSGGPLSYQYRIVEVIIHFGSTSSMGSEHSINGVSFPAELQILGFNSDLYGNLSQAISSTNGLVIVALLCQISESSNEEFKILTQKVGQIKFRGDRVHLREFSVHSLLPSTDDFITYEGSLTQPRCDETVTWILMNKPMYISDNDLLSLRDLMQGDEIEPKIPMENNCRPTMQLYDRPIRTNINFNPSSKDCNMEKKHHYQALVERSL